MAGAGDTKLDISSNVGLPGTSYFTLNTYVHLVLIYTTGIKKTYILDAFLRVQWGCVFSGYEHSTLWVRLKYKTTPEYGVVRILSEDVTQCLENPESRPADSATKEASF